ncbi:MAG: 1-acyl-sn-glycerol-3-phosphate acyltransferase [Bacteroidota bacterium]|nr:MAG: 1-acyl-sn-glycerol-3-phosphate acyltransferase [Bacteroidota bacterium]
MARRDIDKWSVWYWILQKFWVRVNFYLYYKKIGIFNDHLIPSNRSIIIAPNHQNALMDAIAFVSQPPKQRIFLTRADVFNKPFVERILYFMKMLPIFRIRDGRSSLQKNEEIFDTAVEILHNKRSPLFMFPEGNHGDKRRLRPLVKGIFRIAFLAQEKYKDQPGIVIMPVGLDYEHYQKFGKNLLVNYGKPIEVAEFWKDFEENPSIATNNLRDKLSEHMRQCMIDIQSEEYYDTYMHLREIYRPNLLNRLNLKQGNLLHQFQSDKILIEKLDLVLAANPQKIEAIHKLTQEYVFLRDDLQLREWVLRKNGYSWAGIFLRSIASLVLLPVFLFGILNNWPNFFVPFWYVKKIKDTQFRSTAAWGVGLVMQIIYYPILIMLGFVFLPVLWMKLLYIPLIPLSGLAAYRVYTLLVKNRARIKFNLAKNHSSDLRKAIVLRKKIIESLDSLTI